MLIVDREGIVRDVIVGFSQELRSVLSGKIVPLL